MPAKPLSEEQKADAARLRALWDQWRARRRAAGLECSQAFVAHSFGWETQSAVSQYLNGGIPLNAQAVRKWSALLGVAPGEISPSIVLEQQRLAREWLDPSFGGGATRLHPTPQVPSGLRKTRDQKDRDTLKTKKSRSG